MLSEDLDAALVQHQDAAASLGLGVGLDDPPASRIASGSNRQQSRRGGEGEIPPSQPGQLTAAKPGGDHQMPQRPEPIALRGAQELADLFRCVDRTLRGVVLGFFHPGSRVDGQIADALRVAQHVVQDPVDVADLGPRQRSTTVGPLPRSSMYNRWMSDAASRSSRLAPM